MRQVLHTVVSILMWCLFGYYWWIVGRRSINPATLDALTVLAAIVVVGVLLTVAWVLHNLRLARKFGRRKGFPAPVENFDTDYLQRPLVAPPVLTLRDTKIVYVKLDDEGNKVYEIGGRVAD